MKTLIFDLDETLIHCLDEHDVKSMKKQGLGKRRAVDSVLSIKYSKSECLNASIYVRPGAVKCLRKLREHFELVVFTASHACYANKVLELLDPSNELLSYRLYRDHCHKTEEGVYVKDLRIIANRNPKDLILVDNSAYSYGFQPYNGIPIVPYYDSDDDSQLNELADFLLSIKDCEDVRPVLRQAFQIDTVVEHGLDYDDLKTSLLACLD